MTNPEVIGYIYSISFAVSALVVLVPLRIFLHGKQSNPAIWICGFVLKESASQCFIFWPYITLYSELRFRRSCTLWKACEILYKILLTIILFDQSLSTGVTGDNRMNRCFQKSAFIVLRILVITLYSELRFC